MVLSLAPFWWRCSEKAAPAPGEERPPLGDVTWTRPNGEAVTRPEFSRGETVVVTVTAAGAGAGSRIVLPAGFEVGPVTVAGDTLTATVTIRTDAAAGAHPVTVLAADNRVLGERKDAFRVLAGATPEPGRPGGGATPTPGRPGGGATPAPAGPGGGATPEPARPAGGAAAEGRATPRSRKRGKGRARSGQPEGGGERGGGEG
jgi:hypothetical protein